MLIFVILTSYLFTKQLRLSFSVIAKVNSLVVVIFFLESDDNEYCVPL